MKRFLRYILTLVSVTGGVVSFAQAPHSAYFMDNMPNRHLLNPAFTPGFNYVSIPALGNLQIGTNANVGIGDFLFPRNGELVTSLNSSVSSEEFLGRLKSINSIEANVNLEVISFGFKAWGGFNTFNIGVRSHTSVVLPYELFEFAKIGQVNGGPTAYDINDLRLSSTNYVELALGHSHQLTEKLRIGAKFKYIAGLGRADALVENINVQMSEDRWVLREAGSMFTTDAIDIAYKSNGEINNIDFGKIGVSGNGIGIDLGASYDLLDNLTLSASLTDIGFISWNGANATVNPDAFVYDGFHHIGAEDDPITGESALDQEADQLEEDLKKLIRFQNEEKAKSTQSLATTLNIGAEYSILNNKIGFGLLSSTRLGTPRKWTELMASVNFRPASWFHATVNGSTSNLGHSAGLLLNFCPKGFNFFLGADYIPFKYGKQGVPVSTAKVDFVLGFSATFRQGK